MKVLFINSVCGVGSTGRICTDMCDVLSAKGWECKVAYGRGIVPERYRDLAVKIGSDAGVKLHALSARVFDNAGFGSKVATKKFIKWIEKFDPDIIHLHNLHGYYLNVEVLFDYLRRANKPVVWTLHDCWAFTGHCSYFDFAGCEKWKKGCKKCSQKKEYPQSLVLDSSAKNYVKKKSAFGGVKSLTIVTPSKWLCELTKQSFLGRYEVRVINNGIDLSVFKPTENSFKEKNGIADKKMLLGAASVWTRRKGLADFVKLAKELDDSYKIVVAGLDNEQIKALPKEIIGLPPTASAEKLVELYSAADVFVNPTYEDNYPTVNLEAQACGTPVVTYDTGGSPESVDLTVGAVVERGNTDALKDAILKTEKRSPSGIEEFDKKVKYEQYEKLFMEKIK